MPIATIDELGGIITIAHTGVGHQLSIEDMGRINKSKKGHASFKIIDDQLIFDEEADTAIPTFTTENLPVQEVDEKEVAGAIETKGHDIDSMMGHFGNVWVRKIKFDAEGAIFSGHTHAHDHISLLMTGKVLLKVEGFQDTIFTAPTFVTIKAEHEHEIIALEDNTLWWCIHAVRDENNEAVELYTNDNSPYIKPV